MSTTKHHRYRLPRWGAVVLWLIFAPLFHAVLPWALSRLGPRGGWSEAGPVPWNWLGLVPVIVGFGEIAWALAQHYLQTPGGWEFVLKPKVLLVGGPYRYTRNPMYLGAFAIWIGWGWFYGSLAVAAGFSLLFAYMVFVQVPFEERQMESVFGQAYRDYRSAVPRYCSLTNHGRRSRRWRC